MTLPLMGGGDALQGRSQLRKRDFESELLERLLSHGNRGEPLHGGLPPINARPNLNFP